MAGLALADGVNSVNTVGFITHEMDENIGVDNIGVCFSPVGGGAYTVVNDAFGSLTFVSGDSVYIFNGEDWDFDIYNFLGKNQGWQVFTAAGDEDSVASFTVNPGDNLFYAGAVEDINIAGEVAASGTQTVAFDPEENWIFFFANPFPIATTFADLEAFAKSGDAFYRFNPDDWDFDIFNYLWIGRSFYSCFQIILTQYSSISGKY